MKTRIRNSYTPKLGDYCNTFVIDKETGNQYLFDADGVWTLISTDKEGIVTEAVAQANAYTDDVAEGKVDKEEGKGLSENDFTDEDKEKLDDIEEGAQENVIEVIKRNGTALPITDKTVDITVPTKTSDLTNDSNFVSNTDYATASTGGVVKVGSGLEITNGVLSATGGGTADAVDWGHITGSMSNQTDLTTALNAKANTADLEEAVRQLQTGMENAISMVQQDYGIPHYSLYDLPDGTSWNSTTSDNFSVLGVDSPSDLFQGEYPPFVLDCSQLGSYTDDDGGEITVYNILMESGQLFVDEALVEMFIGETFIPSKDDISRGTQFMVIIQRDEDEEVVLRTRAHTIYLN